MADGGDATIVGIVESALLEADALRALMRGAERTAAAQADDIDATPKTDQPAAEDWGFDVDAMNREFGLVLIGSKAVIIREMPRAKVEDRVRILSIEAFRAYFANMFTQVTGVDGKIKTVTWADRWMRDRRRRQFDGIEFHPDRENTGGTPGYLNLWRGFSVEPQRGAGSYTICRDHLLTNVCSNNRELFNWVFGWFAHLVQRPRERIGTALVFRGRMGTGKTKVGEVIGKLIADHYFLVDEPRYITGQFNAHMAACLLMQAEEAVWAGDKAAEGRLKSLITSNMQMIEAKGVDPVRVDNYLRLIMTSNEDWVVPAGKEERRFAVFTVSDLVREDHGYFAEMDDELRAGGYGALLADLLDFDLSSVNLRKIPKTEALLEQKIRSLKHFDRWWLDCLNRGSVVRSGSDWPVEVPKSLLFAEYLADGDRAGIRHRASETEVGMSLAKVVPGLQEVRRRVRTDDGGERRERAYRLPALAACRAAFEELLCQPFAWSDEASAGEGGRDGG